MLNMKFFDNFNGNIGVNSKIINSLNLPKNIPQDYINFLNIMNGGEGFIGEEYLILYKAEDLLKINLEYNVNEYVPGIFLIGSNGAGEAVALDLRLDPAIFILIPFIFEDEAIIKLGINTNEFFKRLFEKGYFD